MQCTSPISIDGRTLPCGRCMACRIAKTREWTNRILREMESWKYNAFITLTYSPDYLPYDNELKKAHVQLFIKRLRGEMSPRKMKYYACGEYGEKFGRPHYHLIAFGIGKADEVLVKDCWPNGFVKMGTVTKYSAQYVAGYIMDKYSGKIGGAFGHKIRPFQLCSNGLGKEWLVKNAEQVCYDMGIRDQGKIQSMPRYYRKLLVGQITDDDFDQRRLARDDERRQKEREAGGDDLSIARRVYDRREVKKEELKQAKQRSDDRKKL